MSRTPVHTMNLHQFIDPETLERASRITRLYEEFAQYCEGWDRHAEGRSAPHMLGGGYPTEKRKASRRVREGYLARKKAVEEGRL